MPYIIYDHITEEFLTKFNAEYPASSAWGGNLREGGYSASDVQTFPTKREAKAVAALQNKCAARDPEEAIDLQVIRVFSRTIYEFEATVRLN